MSNISRYYQVIVNEDGDRWVYGGGPVDWCEEQAPALRLLLKKQSRKVRVAVEPLTRDGVPWVCDWDENSVRQSTPAEQARLTPKPEPLTPAIAKHLGFLG